MSENEERMSQTMRIDLIPDIPAEPVDGQKRVVISSAPPSERRRRPEPIPAGGDSHYQELLQSVYDAALITDMTGRVVDVNIRAIEKFMIERGQLCGLNVVNLISGADGLLVERLAENLKNERYIVIEAYCARGDDTFFPAEITVNMLNLDEMHLAFFVRDITQRRQAEEMLRTEHTAILNASNGIAVADAGGKLEYANPAVAVMWGYASQDDLLGEPVHVLLADSDAFSDMLDQVLSDYATRTLETRAKKLSGEEFYLQVAAACNRNSDGEPVGVVLSFVDISDQKRAEDAEREADRHRVMFESLGAACHHLGQPATVLQANLGIMRKRLVTDDALVNELVKTSIEASESLGEILHRLNAVNEYKTTQYLDKPDGSDSPMNRILDI